MLWPLTAIRDHAMPHKTLAAKMLGLGSYQTLTNWAEKYDLEE